MIDAVSKAVLFILAGALALGVTLRPATAPAFEIRVRAEGQLIVEAVSAGTRLQLTGQLRDDLQQGLPQRRIVVRVTALGAPAPLFERATYTGMRGHFDVAEEVSPGTYDVDVEFAETEHVTGANFEQRIEVEPRPVELRIQAPRYVHGQSAAALVSAHASIESIGLQLDAFVQAGDQALGTVALDRFGRGSLDVRGALIAGHNPIEVTLPASAYRKQVSQSATIRRGDALSLTAATASVFERFERGIEVAGVASDEFGPIEAMAVRVTFRLQALEGRRPADAPQTKDGQSKEGGPGKSEFVRTVQTDTRGRYRAFVSGSELSDGVWLTRAEALPDVGQSIAQDGGPAQLDRASTQRVIDVLGLLALLAGLLFVAQRLVLRLVASFRARRERMQAERLLEGALQNREIIVPVALDEDEHDPGTDDARRMALGGLVWDCWREHAVAGAELDLRSDKQGEPVRVISDGRGRFRFAPLQAGHYTLQIRAKGYVQAELGFEAPHVGTLANFRLELIAVPLKIRRLYQVTMKSVHGEDLWGRLTPRQIEEVVRDVLDERRSDGGSDKILSALRERLEVIADSQAQPPAEEGGSEEHERLLSLLTEIVEQSYFSGRDYEEAYWLAAREIALGLTRAAESSEERP
ncbi:MAG: carboxypeptidase regulatory-like domain-containing protein [Bradymonadaceae bacterium]|nr:carboxypeptidase regulatory-like domain-containing protein [Lujinxingiaceae bacterium]